MNTPTITAEQVTELYKQGCSDKQVYTRLGIPRRQWERELADNAIFRAIVEMGRDYAEAFWEDQWIDGIRNKDVNPNILKPVMQQRYGWSDKTESKNANINAELTPEQMMERLSQQLRQLPQDQIVKIVPSGLLEHFKNVEGGADEQID